MGFMTEISILNDNWHRLKERILSDPKSFTDEIDVLMHGRPQYRAIAGTAKQEYVGSKWSDEIRAPGTVGYSTVYRSHHADDSRVYVAFQNSFMAIDSYIIEAEYEGRLGNDNTLDHIERMAKIAENRAKDVLKLVKEKRAAQKAVTA